MPSPAKIVAVSFVASDSMSGALRRMSRNLLYFESSLGGVALAAGGLLAAGSLLLLAKQTYDLGKASIQAASEFETSFTGVLKTTNNLVDNATGQLTELGKTVRKELRETAKEVPTTANTNIYYHI